MWMALLAAVSLWRPPLQSSFEWDIGARTRLLVLSPHPDDAALAAAGLIRRVVTSGGQVRIVQMTSGDAFAAAVARQERIAHPSPVDYQRFGKLRERETMAAMGLLGVARDRIVFLGFPDAGLCRLASTYLRAESPAYQSPFTDRASPPLAEQVIHGVRYRGSDVLRELEREMMDFAPTLIVLPYSQDQHPDHCSTYIFGHEAMKAVAGRRTSQPPRVLYYLVHHKQWPLNDDLGRGSALRPPADLRFSDGVWRSLDLTNAEVALKKRALLLYTSQLRVIGPFMLAFGRQNELFLEGDPTSKPECWCDDDTVATDMAPTRSGRRPSRQP